MPKKLPHFAGARSKKTKKRGQVAEPTVPRAKAEAGASVPASVPPRPYAPARPAAPVVRPRPALPGRAPRGAAPLPAAYDYVTTDLRRIGVLAGATVAVIVVAAVVFR